MAESEAPEVMLWLRGTELREGREALSPTDRHSIGAAEKYKIMAKGRYKRQGKRESVSSNSIDDDINNVAELRLFDQPDPLTNMVLVVEDEELHVHKEVLAGWSSVFMAMFSSPFVEKDSKRVVLAGKSLEDVRLLLNCLYPPNTHTVTKDNIMQLLPLIEEYDIVALKKKCKEIILSYDPSLDVVLLANEYHMLDIMDEAIEACSDLPMSSIDHKKNKDLTDHIPPQYMLDIYRGKILSQAEQLKHYKKLRDRVAFTAEKLQRFGKAANSYPCEKHREFNDDCALCLTNFRDAVFGEFENLITSHLR